jgi:hypothetical protein
MVITRQDTSGNCYHTDDNGFSGTGGGGFTVQNVTFNAPSAGTAVYTNNTAEIVFRGCTFNGLVTNNGYWIADYLHCTFNRPGNVGFKGTGGTYVGITT